MLLMDHAALGGRLLEPYRSGSRARRRARTTFPAQSAGDIVTEVDAQGAPAVGLQRLNVALGRAGYRVRSRSSNSARCAIVRHGSTRRSRRSSIGWRYAMNRAPAAAAAAPSIHESPMT